MRWLIASGPVPSPPVRIWRMTGQRSSKFLIMLNSLVLRLLLVDRTDQYVGIPLKTFIESITDFGSGGDTDEFTHTSKNIYAELDGGSRTGDAILYLIRMDDWCYPKVVSQLSFVQTAESAGNHSTWQLRPIRAGPDGPPARRFRNVKVQCVANYLTRIAS